MTSPEERIFAGQIFDPSHPVLRDIKRKAHRLDMRYNALPENEAEQRAGILRELLGEIGEGSFIQGPVYLHYGTHTRIGKRFFGNFDLTIQDDAAVTIGDDCNFGPNVTIVTPLHPMVPKSARRSMRRTGRPTACAMPSQSSLAAAAGWGLMWWCAPV